MQVPKFVSEIVFYKWRLWTFYEKERHFIYQIPPIIWLQMDSQKVLLELLKTLLEKWKGRIRFCLDTELHHKVPMVFHPLNF